VKNGSVETAPTILLVVASPA